MMASEVVNYCNRQNCINPDQRAFGLKFCLCQNQAGKTYKLSSLRAFFFCVCVSVCPWVNQLQASRKADFCLIEVVQVQRRGIPSNADGTVKIFNPQNPSLNCNVLNVKGRQHNKFIELKGPRLKTQNASG